MKRHFLLLILFTQIAPTMRQRPNFACGKPQGSSDPLFSFWPKARQNKAPEPTSAADVGHFCLFALNLPFLPSSSPRSAATAGKQSESRGSGGEGAAAGRRIGSSKKERQQQGQQQQRQRQRQQRQRQQRQAAEAAEAEAEAAAATATHQQPAATGHRGSCSRAAARPASCKHSSSSSGGSGSSHPAN